MVRSILRPDSAICIPPAQTYVLKIKRLVRGRFRVPTPFGPLRPSLTHPGPRTGTLEPAAAGPSARPGVGPYQQPFNTGSFIPRARPSTRTRGWRMGREVPLPGCCVRHQPNLANSAGFTETAAGLSPRSKRSFAALQKPSKRRAQGGGHGCGNLQGDESLLAGFGPSPANPLRISTARVGNVSRYSSTNLRVATLRRTLGSRPYRPYLPRR